MRSLKKVRKANPGMSIHHRRCRSHGGGSDLSNLSILPPQWHRDWHTLFGNRRAYGIAKDLQRSYFCDEQFSVWYGDTFKHITVTKTVGVTAKKEAAWKRLFGGMSVTVVLLMINSLFIDPQYVIKRRTA